MLNDWENHRTETDYESSLVSKIFITNFLTGYLSLFLIAWVYIPFGEAITPYLTLANIPHHHKPVGPERLKAQVAYFVIVGQVINFATEVVVPYLLRFAIGEAKEKITGEKVHTDSGADKAEEAAFLRRVRAEVALRNYDVYEDYAEMTVQNDWRCGARGNCAER
ncbi:calcium-activated chloride channel-domain-containing protein [Jimgerdemannia flammicorona]|uniref:Calcium-activated chloride channel-domain-containing protein n=1 Tax=Jimgerdemannia flammicorona TaxID=994334 RepID=A0A433PE10_9FUNG|nr:calcium-activated chloride channel-domain-containing protein [Jimgerdemannia flammicorona]